MTQPPTPDAIAACRREVAEAVTLATRAGVGFEQGMIEARRLAADADRKVADAFATLTDRLAQIGAVPAAGEDVPTKAALRAAVQELVGSAHEYLESFWEGQEPIHHSRYEAAGKALDDLIDRLPIPDAAARAGGEDDE